MSTFRALARSPYTWRAGWLSLLCSIVLTVVGSGAFAQDDEGGDDGFESSFTVNAMMKLQGGLFVPLASDGFQPLENRAEGRTNPLFPAMPCNPVETPKKPCVPTDHGQKPGTPSITRATLQLEAHWDLTSRIAIHAIVRGTRSMQLPADEYAQVPRYVATERDENGFLESPAQTVARQRKHAKKWVQENQYNTFELREFYADIIATNWLNFRIGRQQVAWGETGSFRLLDVVNPINSTWHFGPLESFEDQRIPLWMLLTNIEIPQAAAALELLYIPGVDRARDTVSTPLSMSGAWGVPYSNTPPTFITYYKDFQYPGGKLSPNNMRYGVRWKGDLGEHVSYSLVYMYTHMMTPVLERVYLRPVIGADGNPTGSVDANTADSAKLTFPRQHIAGLSLEYAVPSPVALTMRFEGAFEPNRMYSTKTDGAGLMTGARIDYDPRPKKVANYAIVLQRPTMIRWLNPVQNFLLVAQFQHTHVLDVPDSKTSVTDADLVNALGYQTWRVQKNSFALVFFATTQYLNGLITPRLTGVYAPNRYYGDSGFISFDLGFRIGPHYRLNVTVTDFFGKNPYRDLGLFRDRDEVHAAATVLF